MKANLLLQEEHEGIRQRRATPDSEITWEEYKSMKFTSHVYLFVLPHLILTAAPNYLVHGQVMQVYVFI
jgi:hypothetical protein